MKQELKKFKCTEMIPATERITYITAESYESLREAVKKGIKIEEVKKEN